LTLNTIIIVTNLIVMMTPCQTSFTLLLKIRFN